jgi:radical SAM protein with 4Fe4S-binding SPASM domain
MTAPYFIFEITPRCTSDCLYCYNVWKQDGNYPIGEMSLPEIKRLFNKLSDETAISGVTLTGGEPLLRADILEVVSFLSEKKIKVGIATNGVLLDEATTRKLAENGAGYFEISLPSMDKDNYSRLTRDDRLKKVREAIINVKKEKAKLTVSIVLTKLNLDELEENIDLCFAFSADAVALNRFVPGGKGLKHLSDLQITKAELQSALSIADRKSSKHNMQINVTIPVESCIIDHKLCPHLNFGSCACGRDKLVIDPIGNLRTCEQNPDILGNLFNNRFSELARSEPADRFQQDNLKSGCGECERFRYCGGGCRFMRN